MSQRIINEEYKPFGLCSPEVQEQIIKHYHDFTGATDVLGADGWEKVLHRPSDFPQYTYRVILPKGKVKVPLDVDGWLKVARVRLNDGWDNRFVIRSNGVNFTSHGSFTFSQLVDHKAVDPLGNDIKLYKYAEEAE